MRDEDPKEMGASTRRRWRRTNPVAASSTLRAPTEEGPWMIDFAPWRSQATVRSPEGRLEVRLQRGVYKLRQGDRIVARARRDGRGLTIEEADGQRWSLADSTESAATVGRIHWLQLSSPGEEELDTELPQEASMAVHALAAAALCVNRPTVNGLALIVGTMLLVEIVYLLASFFVPGFPPGT